MKHYVSRKNWTTHLPTLVQNAADGDTIVAYSDHQVALAERTRARMCPQKTLLFTTISLVTTTTAYWDCECEIDYIHPKTEESCARCGAVADEQPDSLISEVATYGFPITEV